MKLTKKSIKREIITKKETKDKMGVGIPKGTTLYVIEELENPMSHKDELIVCVDNGTGIYDLMPKTLVEKDMVE